MPSFAIVAEVTGIAVDGGVLVIVVGLLAALFMFVRCGKKDPDASRRLRGKASRSVSFHQCSHVQRCHHDT